MSTTKWAAAEAAQTALDTGLNSLGDGSTALSTAINNDSDLYLYMGLELYLASIANGATPNVDVYVIASLDGTNYEDGSAGTPGTIPDRPPDASFPLKPSTTTASRKVFSGIPIPSCKFKLLLVNSAGVAFAASGNTLKYSRCNMQGV